MAAGHTHHIVFDCPLYATERARWPPLFEPSVLESDRPLHASSSSQPTPSPVSVLLCAAAGG